MITVTGMDAAFATIDKWLADAEALAVEAAIGLAYKAFEIVLWNSPQYSGDFVANWKLSAGKPDVSFQAGLFPEMTYPVDDDKQPFKRGDTTAISYAVTASNGALAGATLGETLWLSNTAQHDDLYAWKIEDNLIRFRPVNFGGEGPLGKARDVLTTRYHEITKHNVGELL